MDGRRTAVFDLDGTLLTGDSFGGLLRRLITGSPVRLVAVVALAPLGLALLARPRTRQWAERWVVWVATAGRTEESFADVVREFAAAHAGEAGGRRIEAALRRAREHLDAGDRVIVATACAEVLAVAVRDALELDGAEVVASSFTRRRWTLPRGVPARGAAKVRALEAAGVPLPVDDAYSDSAHDLPLLRAARTAHLVCPKPADEKVLRRALGPEVEVLR
jgi:phosphatidylglycerophosphatase C